MQLFGTGEEDMASGGTWKLWKPRTSYFVPHKTGTLIVWPCLGISVALEIVSDPPPQILLEGLKCRPFRLSVSHILL